jgi:hypothetical protein
MFYLAAAKSNNYKVLMKNYFIYKYLFFKIKLYEFCLFIKIITQTKIYYKKIKFVLFKEILFKIIVTLLKTYDILLIF